MLSIFSRFSLNFYYFFPQILNPSCHLEAEEAAVVADLEAEAAVLVDEVRKTKEKLFHCMLEF